MTGLSWRQGPLAVKGVGRFLVPGPLPERMLFAEPARRRMRVRLGETWIADSEDVILLHEPGRYPVAYFPLGDVGPDVLQPTGRVTTHRDLGATAWFTVHEEDERIVGHAADLYHRNDIRKTSHHLVVRDGDRIIADTQHPFVLYESGFAPRWYVPRTDIDDTALSPVDGQTFCPYKGLASYYAIGEHRRRAWSYLDAWPEVRRVAGLVSFEPDKIEVSLDGRRLELGPGQSVTPHGVDRGLDVEEIQSH